MKTSSLVRRAATAVLVIQFCCALTFAGAALWHERQARLRALDQMLQGRSDSLIGAVQDAEDPQDNVRIDPEEFAPHPGDQFAVYNPDGRLVGASPGDTSVVVPRNHDGIRNVRFRHHRFRVLERDAMRIIDRYETQGVGLRRPVKVVYAIPADHMWHEVVEAARFYVLLSLASMIVTALVLVWLAKLLLKPLNGLAAAAGGIGPSSLEFNPPGSAAHTAELRPLADALSRMVERLREAFETERRFMNDAAHELKTAVAVVRSTVQVLTMRNRSMEEYRAGLEQILADNARVEGLVSRMLTLARFEAQAAPPEGSGLHEHAGIAVSRLISYAQERGVSVRIGDGSDVSGRIAPEALQVLVSNLVMNAIQHSPRGSEVLVTVCDDASTETPAMIRVQDWGEGIAEENLPHVFDRFFREDPSRSRETGGVGLGLSICKSIVENAGGTITLESRKGVGTTATVSLPAPAASRPE